VHGRAAPWDYEIRTEFGCMMHPVRNRRNAVIPQCSSLRRDGQCRQRAAI
jgi:hypothetical protein